VATQTPTNFQLEIGVTATNSNLAAAISAHQRLRLKGWTSVNSWKTLELLILVMATVFQLMVVVRAGEMYTQSVYYRLQRTLLLSMFSKADAWIGDDKEKRSAEGQCLK
jgi:hypothetical protein